MGTTPIKIILIDDHPVVLEGLTSGLRQYPDLDIVGTAVNVQDAKSLISAGGFGGRSIVPETGEVPTPLTVMFVLRVAGGSLPPIR